MIRKRTLILLLIGMLPVMACVLSTDVAAAPTVPITPSVLPFSTATPIPLIELPTLQPTVIANQSCTVNTSGFLYTVQTGDILSSLAARSGTTTANLIGTNCLTNPDNLTVGQTLYVPRQPSVTTPRPAPTLRSTGCVPRTDWSPYMAVKGDTLAFLAGFGSTTIEALLSGNCWTDQNAFYAGVQMRVPSIPGRDGGVTICPAVEFGGVGTLVITPSDRISDTCFHVRQGALVTIAWVNAPANLIEAQFWFAAVPDPQTNFSGKPDVIGVIRNISGTPSLAWTVYAANVSGTMYAFGTPQTGKSITSGTTGVSTW